MKRAMLKVVIVAVFPGFLLFLTEMAAASEANEILRITDVRGGLVVHIRCGDGRLTAALSPRDGYVVHGLDTDPANVQNARAYIRSLGRYGQVSVAPSTRPQAFRPRASTVSNRTYSLPTENCSTSGIRRSTRISPWPIRPAPT
jgi:hypothetical protein